MPDSHSVESTPPLPWLEPRSGSFDRGRFRDRVRAWAAQGVFLGTSSWKYPGWRGQLYDESRYLWRGKFAESRFNERCLSEYAQVFRTVCVDAAYYKFPDRRYLGGLFGQVPRDFLFSFKVTDEITVKRFTNLPRFGQRAGQPNENFLNADLFSTAFLAPCEPFKENISLLVFEFSRFYPADFARGRDFIAALDGFLEKLPPSWPYGVEIRNRRFLHSDYFATLARHRVAHIYNSWYDMPSVGEQLARPESRTQPALVGARFLLKPGRKYETAVKLFSPYDRVKEVDAEGRQAGAKLIQQCRDMSGRRRAFIYVNNRFEGNALGTIEAMMDQAEAG